MCRLKWSIFGFCIVALGGCTIFYRANTPEGVNVNAIHLLELGNNIVNVDTLQKHLPQNSRHQMEGSADVWFFYSPHSSVRLSRFQEIRNAAAEYETIRNVVLSTLSLYKQGEAETNKYFSAYKKPWLNTNHGIPNGVITYPAIELVFLKSNLLITISYNKHKEIANYTDELNEDMKFISSLIKSVIRDVRPTLIPPKSDRSGGL